jgi:hypothetical protein
MLEIYMTIAFTACCGKLQGMLVVRFREELTRPTVEGGKMSHDRIWHSAPGRRDREHPPTRRQEHLHAKSHPTRWHPHAKSAKSGPGNELASTSKASLSSLFFFFYRSSGTGTKLRLFVQRAISSNRLRWTFWIILSDGV